jgi:DNA polymerase III subunit delta'
LLTAVEVEARKSILNGTGENLSAVQKQSLEKEVEGSISMYGMREASSLLNVVFSWYRDMHLLHLNGNRSFLFNSDYMEACGRAFAS